MRTTLVIEDDVLQAAKEMAHREGVSAGKIISQLARKGLSAPSPTRKGEQLRGGVPILESRNEVVTLEHVQYLMDQEGV
jgi:hypothetical protein